MSRKMSGVLMATVWNAWTLAVVNIVAVRAGWWTYTSESAPVLGMPTELWFVWLLLWGVAAPLLASGRPIAVVVVGFLWLDLIVMPEFDDYVVLHGSWLVGEVFAIVVALIPGLLFARWTECREKLAWRAAFQVISSAGLFVWMIPGAALARTGGWGEVLALPGWRIGLVVQLALLPVALGARAVLEFVTRGGGTPVPYDPTQRLVRSGPYSYLRNPMQFAMTILFVILGIGFGNVWLLFAAVAAWAYSAGLAEWHEGAQLAERFGQPWSAYRKEVRAWIPRFRPASSEATLLIAFSCGTCSQIGRWLVKRRPIGLALEPAEDVEEPGLDRVTYVASDGSRYRGVAAIARALEHIHLGWALVGWFLLLPGVNWFAQLLADVFGPGPQRVQGRSYDAAACPSRPL